MDQKRYRVMYDAEDSHWWYRGLHDLVCETDTLHPGTGRVIQRIQKELYRKWGQPLTRDKDAYEIEKNVF